MSSPSLPWWYGSRQQGWHTSGTLRKQFPNLTVQFILSLSINLGFSQGLTSAEIALVVICVLIVVIFLALAAFLYCTGRLIGCCGGVGDNMNKNKKGKGPSSAEARKKAEAEKRLRDIR